MLVVWSASHIATVVLPLYPTLPSLLLRLSVSIILTAQRGIVIDVAATSVVVQPLVPMARLLVAKHTNDETVVPNLASVPV